MKIRQGFVSNSSSSSFLIYGAKLNSDEVSAWDDYSNKERKGLTALEIMIPKGESVVEAHGRYDGYSCYLGRSWDTIKDDETGAEFKASVRKAVATILGKDEKEIQFRTHEDAWYDG